MTLTVEVIHCAFEDVPIHVATVQSAPHHNTIEACEFAFRWTQNIHDSWSMKGELDGSHNVFVMAPLHQGKDGQPLGLRSTSVGDRMIINGVVFEVAPNGFELLTPII